MLDIRERIKGALIGVAYGDSLGMPGEMWSREEIREKLGEITSFQSGHPDNPISSRLVRGEVTDDTINTLLVVDMLAENHGKVDCMLFIRKLKAWIACSEKSSAVVGPSTAKAISLIDSGVPVSETGKTGITNGGAMKILPVGLAVGMKQGWTMEELADEAANLCMPTHHTSVAVSAACAIGAGAACALREGADVAQIWEGMIAGAEQGSLKGCPAAAPSVAARMQMGRYFAGNYDTESALQNIYDYIGTGLSSAESIPAAASLFLLAEGDPLACGRYAANLGGDTDTIGAMACGICGAYKGSGAFLEEDVRLLEKVNGISFEEYTDKLMKCSA